ncbi:MAG TPA: DNA methyltransferase [Acidimicrobiales bacterium]|nr:DNA methyltransferase [Acidimicrobiales bacterium]
MSAERWQLLPSLSPDEFQALKEDIAAHGLRVPIVVDATSGLVLDGHHRQRAIDELRCEGIKVADFRDVRAFGDDDERLAFVLAANLFRRHLNRTQRNELVTKLRESGWSLRRIGETVGVAVGTVHKDLAGVQDRTPERVRGRDAKVYRARRPKVSPSVIVGTARDEARARRALLALGEEASGLISLPRAEERARLAELARKREAVVVPVSEGPGYELKSGDFREVLADLAHGSVDAIVTDPPYNRAGIPLFEDLGAFGARVLKPGRLAVVYAGHLELDTEMELLARGGLSYCWHGANVLAGLHTKVHARMVFGWHRSVLLYSAGPYQPRSWINDLAFAEGKGGPQERPLHPWQQALEPVRHWVRQVSKPGELICDPFLGSGTTAVACLLEGRRFIGCDIDPGCVETTRQRLAETLDEIAAKRGAGDAS